MQPRPEAVRSRRGPALNPCGTTNNFGSVGGLSIGRVPIKWTHLIDKDAAQNQRVGACPSRKSRTDFRGMLNFALMPHAASIRDFASPRRMHLAEIVELGDHNRVTPNSFAKTEVQDHSCRSRTPAPFFPTVLLEHPDERARRIMRGESGLEIGTSRLKRQFVQQERHANQHACAKLPTDGAKMGGVRGGITLYFRHVLMFEAKRIGFKGRRSPRS